MKPSPSIQAKSASTLKKALAGVECSAGLGAALRAGDVAVINLSKPAAAPETPPAPPRPKPR